MRFALSAASVLFAGLLSSAAFADEAAPAPAPAPAPTAPAAASKKVPLRVVRVLSETHQALLFNKAKNTHVLVEMGKEVDGYTVDDIDEDSVTLTPIEGGAQVVLAGPDPSWRHHGDKPSSDHTLAPALRAPEDPYASAAPMDPYGDSTIPTPITAGEGGVRTAEAPGASPAPIRTAEAPGSAPTILSTPTPVITVVATPAPTPVRVAPAPAPAAPEDTSSAAAWGNAPTQPTQPATPATPTAPATRTALTALAETGITVTEATPALDSPTLIPRTDITAALANFGALASSIRGSFTPTGARLDAISPDSLLAKAGLRNGDVITSINNQPLRSLDDAANLYARAGSMKAATILLQRAGKPVTLRLAFP